MKTHIGIKVSDIDKTQQFYTNFFGQAPSKVKEKYVKFDLEKPGLVISFSQKNELESIHNAHYGIKVDSKEDLGNWFEAVKNRSLEVYDVENNVKCCFALQDKFWVKDPDGIMWEVYQLLEDVEVNDDKYNASAAQDENKKTDACCN